MNTLIQQSAFQRNQRIAAKSFYATLSMGAVVEFFGISSDHYPPVLTWENSVIFATSFLLIFAYVWLTGKRNIQVRISDAGLEVSHDEEILRCTWNDVRRWQQPVFMVKSYWLFELKNARKIKISTRCFSKKQVGKMRNAFSAVINPVLS